MIRRTKKDFRKEIIKTARQIDQAIQKRFDEQAARIKRLEKVVFK